MRRICLIIEYDGTPFAGWQRQDNASSVQEEIEKNLKIITKEEITINGSGRTDAGVHALAQVAHFDTSARMDADKFTNALNSHLPLSIRIRKSFEVPLSFHARFSARSKHYRFQIENLPIASALHCNHYLHIYHPLDEKIMNLAAQFFLGEHDFCNFTTTNCKIENTIRRIYLSKVERQGNIITFDVVGSGFLYNMVRRMAGALIEVGIGKKELNDVNTLVNDQNTELKIATASAHALTLISVNYDNFNSIDCATSQFFVANTQNPTINERL